MISFRLGVLTLPLGLFVLPAAAQQVPSSQPAAVLVSGPDVGARAPDFSLPWADRDSVGPGDQWFSLSGLKGKTVVLVFYARDFTPTSTADLTSLNQQYDELFGANAVVVAISPDSLNTHRQFAGSLGLRFRLLADLDQQVAKKYGSADQPGYDRRTVYVIDRKGKVAYQDLQFNSRDGKACQRLKRAVADTSKP